MIDISNHHLLVTRGVLKIIIAIMRTTELVMFLICDMTSRTRGGPLICIYGMVVSTYDTCIHHGETLDVVVQKIA